MKSKHLTMDVGVGVGVVWCGVGEGGVLLY